MEVTKSELGKQGMNLFVRTNRCSLIQPSTHRFIEEIIKTPHKRLSVVMTGFKAYYRNNGIFQHQTSSHPIVVFDFNKKIVFFPIFGDTRKRQEILYLVKTFMQQRDDFKAEFVANDTLQEIQLDIGGKQL